MRADIIVRGAIYCIYVICIKSVGNSSILEIMAEVRRPWPPTIEAQLRPCVPGKPV